MGRNKKKRQLRKKKRAAAKLVQRIERKEERATIVRQQISEARFARALTGTDVMKKNSLTGNTAKKQRAVLGGALLTRKTSSLSRATDRERRREEHFVGFEEVRGVKRVGVDGGKEFCVME